MLFQWVIKNCMEQSLKKKISSWDSNMYTMLKNMARVVVDRGSLRCPQVPICQSINNTAALPVPEDQFQDTFGSNYHPILDIPIWGGTLFWKTVWANMGSCPILDSPHESCSMLDCQYGVMSHIGCQYGVLYILVPHPYLGPSLWYSMVLRMY